MKRSKPTSSGFFWIAALAVGFATLSGCNSTSTCDPDGPVVVTTSEGVDFVRTPDSCFESLPDWPYEAKYVELDGMRQAYVDEGPPEGPIVLLLHGQPSWSYLYRKMIPILVNGGFRVIAMDHLGMGRSDKPTDIAAYSYLGHVDRLERFIQELGLRDINLFCQDWGSLIGLRVVGTHPEWFARVAVGDGSLPVVPAGAQPYPPVENPNEVSDVAFPFAAIPAQQPLFYDGCEPLAPGGDGFGEWMLYAMKSRDFQPSIVLEALTWFDLPSDEEAAYDAPFPSREYMAGPRVFPSLVNDLPGVNDSAWQGLLAFDNPFLTLWAANDPGNLGQCATQDQLLVSIPGASGLPHARLPEASHFLQDDQGEQIAQRLVGFYSGQLVPLARGARYCEILLVREGGGTPSAEVWGTQYLNDCPSAEWEALDPSTIQSETDALAVVMNGPRMWLTDSITGSGGSAAGAQRMTFGGLPMNLLATVDIGAGQMGGDYEPATVLRTTSYIFREGDEIYELIDPDGNPFVMQSVSQIVDSNLSLEDLAGLGAELNLPSGWSFTARVLEEPLIVKANGAATVIQDEFQNTYQRLTPDEPAGGLPILSDGTGTVCSSDAECMGLDAAHCLATNAGGYCTAEGCSPGGCGAPYVCCHSCDPMFASFLPFEDSACIPGTQSSQLAGTTGCTCE